MTTKRRKSHPIRWALAIISALLLLGTIAYAMFYKTSYVNPRRPLAELPFNAMTDAAIHLRVDESKNLFDVGLLILGVLWGLIIAKSDQAQITLSDWPELIMFVSANLLLSLSFIWHNFYLEEMGYYYLVGGKTCSSGGESCVPDVFAKPVDYLYWFQESFLVLGILLAVLTLISAHKLKDDIS